MKQAGISRTFYNDDLNRCLEEILGYLEEQIKA